MMGIKELRKAAGLTQQALGDAVSMNLRQIQKLESGEYQIGNITFKNGVALAEALGVEPKELLRH